MESFFVALVFWITELFSSELRSNGLSAASNEDFSISILDVWCWNIYVSQQNSCLLADTTIFPFLESFIFIWTAHNLYGR